MRERFATAPAIYGLIVFQVLLAAESDDPHEPTLLVLAWAALSFIGFYVAHVFAEVLARHGSAPLPAAIRHGFLHSNGMLYAAVPPTITMLICAAVGMGGDDADGWALLVGLVVLGYLGYEAVAQRGRPVWSRLLAALATALIGFFVILIEFVVH